MDEKTKNIISYVLSILIVGGIITSFIIDTYISLIGLLCIVLVILCLVIMIYIIEWLRGLLYDFFSSDSFQKVYCKYISKHYESRRQLIYYRGSEICLKCGENCVLKYPLRRYNGDSYCKKSVDLFIKEHGLKVDELTDSST